jgi:hypothetical protein
LLKSQLRPSRDASTHEQVLRVRSSKSWSGLSKKRKPLRNGETEPWSVRELEAGRHLTAVCPVLGL